MQVPKLLSQLMAEVAGWLVALLVAAIAAMLGYMRQLKAKAHQAPAPPVPTKVLVEEEQTAAAAQADIDALWDDHQSDNPAEQIANAANAAREQR